MDSDVKWMLLTLLSLVIVTVISFTVGYVIAEDNVFQTMRIDCAENSVYTFKDTNFYCMEFTEHPPTVAPLIRS